MNRNHQGMFLCIGVFMVIGSFVWAQRPKDAVLYEMPGYANVEFWRGLRDAAAHKIPFLEFIKGRTWLNGQDFPSFKKTVKSLLKAVKQRDRFAAQNALEYLQKIVDTLPWHLKDKISPLIQDIRVITECMDQKEVCAVR